MPGTNLSAEQFLFATLKKINQQLAAQGRQQNMAWTTPNGIVVLQVGILPDSGDFALAAYDLEGNLRAQMGELPSGDYGFMVADPVTGNQNEVWPVASALGLVPSQSTSSSSLVNLTGSPSVSVYIGASGDALVTVCSYIGVAAAGAGNVALLVDGAVYDSDTIGLSITSGGGIAADVSTTRRLSQWEGGVTPSTEHVFSLQYATNGTSSTFGAAGIVVQPL